MDLEVHLTHALTPNVKKLRMQNVGDDCAFHVTLPKLREVTSYTLLTPNPRP